MYKLAKAKLDNRYSRDVCTLQVIDLKWIIVLFSALFGRNMLSNIFDFESLSVSQCLVFRLHRDFEFIFWRYPNYLHNERRDQWQGL